MQFKNYKLFSTILFVLLANFLYAQPPTGTVVINTVDGQAANPCFNTGTVGDEVTPSNMDLMVTLTIAGMPPAGSFLQIQHKYSNTIPGGPIMTSNNAQFLDPVTDGSYSYTVTLNNSVYDGEPFTHNFIQFILWTDDFGAQLSECRVFFTMDSVLPVKLTNFNVEETKRTNTIEWQTASEINNEYFEIERSIDGRNFEPIGTVEGKGTSYGLANYQFVDRLPSTMSYYRLRQVDFDGAFEYSDVISVSRGARGGDDFSVYPIPARDRLNIEYSAAEADEMNISVISITGKVLTTQTVTNQKGRNLFNIDSADLVSGTYILRIETGETQINKLFTK